MGRNQNTIVATAGAAIGCDIFTGPNQQSFDIWTKTHVLYSGDSSEQVFDGTTNLRCGPVFHPRSARLSCSHAS